MAMSMSKMLYSSHLFTLLQRSGRWYFVSFFLYCNVALFFMLCDPLLPNFIPRWGLAIPDFPGLFEKSSFKMADSQRLVRVKTRTKAFFFEEILINIPSENLSKLSKERMQYFCHALKLNLRQPTLSHKSKHCSMNRSLEPKMTINFLQHWILYLILPASE